MPDAYRATLYRLIFALAAGYNIAFGLWAGFWPHAFFDLFQLEAPRYPSLWACLGMVVGVYGLAYAYAARRLDAARPFIAIGLLGKLLGPAGWIVAVTSGELPARTVTLIVLNDVVWWVPFSLFLLEGTRAGARFRRAAPYSCAVVHAAGSLAMLLWLGPGTDVEPDLAARAAYIAAHPLAWRAGWALWIAAAVSLVGFYAWWGARLRQARWGVAAFLIASAGLACDVTAESLFIGWLPEDLDEIARAGTLLTSGLANAFYCVGGIVLTVATRALDGWLRVMTWGIWAAGTVLTATAFAGSTAGMVASAAVLMTLFCPWTILLARRFDSEVQ